MALNPLHQMLAETDARADVALLVARYLIQYTAAGQPDRRAFISRAFDDLSLFLDQIEEHPSAGEYGDALRAARRRTLDDLAGSVTRDARLDQGPPPE